MHLYSAITLYTQSAQTWITQFYLEITPRLPLLKHSPDGAIRATQRTSDYSSLLTNRPRNDERLSSPSWLNG